MLQGPPLHILGLLEAGATGVRIRSASYVNLPPSLTVRTQRWCNLRGSGPSRPGQTGEIE
ncbi:protein of unknown function [Azospirillum baldaniorum]|uniref:Uncharacterized protein n=1 Tax=Azospirillum baldaniorum TaxID=1064539 RepID=A0A9P1JN12_9PROT|nr:protein of unknown function [Azospirillum baldaniorum]